MKKTEQNLLILRVAFIVALIVSNVVAGKLVQYGPFLAPSAVAGYAITFLATDVIGEIWGKDEANKTVKIGLMAQILALVLIFISLALPAASFATEFSDMFTAVLGQSARMVIASLIGYMFAQANDVFIFHKLKAKMNGKHKWVRNNVSTICSQFIDTSIFITIAFYGTVPSLLTLIIGQFAVKVILALFDTPIFYLLTRNSDKN